MTEQAVHLLVVDFPSIKKFVFGTDKLVEIRGASGLLDELNRKTLPDKLSNELGKENVECIYVGGGAGQFIIKAEKTKIENVLLNFKGQCLEKSGGALRLNYVLQIMNSDYTQTKNLAYRALRSFKEENPGVRGYLPHTGWIKECSSCSSYAEEEVAHGGETSLLCAACTAKTRYAQQKSHGLWKEFTSFLSTKDYDFEEVMQAMPQSFVDVGQACKTKNNYVGVIYADGNAMGRLIKELPSKEDFEFFSKVVDQAIRDSCHEALYEYCLAKWPAKHIPALILLLGGDDLLVYTPADLAVPVAIKAAELFESKTREAFKGNHFFQKKLEGKGLTISLGIAFGKANTPFSLLLDQAEQLLNSAKQSGAKDSRTTGFYAPAYLDFHFTTRFNQIRINQCRQEHLMLKNQNNNLYLTAKPYSLEDAKKLYEQAGFLNAANIPRTRLKRLAQIPSLGRVWGNLEFYEVLSRTKGKYLGKPKKSILWESLQSFDCRLDEAPWRLKDDLIDTPLADLMELVEFTPKKNEESHAPNAY